MQNAIGIASAIHSARIRSDAVALGLLIGLLILPLLPGSLGQVVCLR